MSLSDIQILQMSEKKKPAALSLTWARFVSLTRLTKWEVTLWQHGSSPTVPQPWWMRRSVNDKRPGFPLQREATCAFNLACSREECTGRECARMYVCVCAYERVCLLRHKRAFVTQQRRRWMTSSVPLWDRGISLRVCVCVRFCVCTVQFHFSHEITYRWLPFLIR